MNGRQLTTRRDVGERQRRLVAALGSYCQPRRFADEVEHVRMVAGLRPGRRLAPFDGRVVDLEKVLDQPVLAGRPVSPADGRSVDFMSNRPMDRVQVGGDDDVLLVGGLSRRTGRSDCIDGEELRGLGDLMAADFLAPERRRGPMAVTVM